MGKKRGPGRRSDAAGGVCSMEKIPGDVRGRDHITLKFEKGRKRGKAKGKGGREPPCPNRGLSSRGKGGG